jgi:hypothetical protein
MATQASRDSVAADDESLSELVLFWAVSKRTRTCKDSEANANIAHHGTKELRISALTSEIVIKSTALYCTHKTESQSNVEHEIRGSPFPIKTAIKTYRGRSDPDILPLA